MISSAALKIRQLLRHQDSASLDTHARGVERHRRALLTGSVAMIARVMQIGTSLITVPLTLKYLGNERFGLWMTISSILAMASFADFGVGNGVLNMVSSAFGRDDLEGIRKAVSSGFAILSSIALLLLLSFAAIFRFINCGDFFRVSSPQARSEAGPALAVFAVCFALNISMDVVQRVQLGLQQGYRYSLWQLCGSTMVFGGVMCGLWFHVSLPVLVMAVAGAPVISTMLNTIHFFGFVQPGLRPTWALISRDVIAQITKLGGLFFVLQVVASLSSSADNFIIARNLGALNVTEYSIPQRMFGLIGMVLAMLVAPFWPAYSEAISRRHFAWVRRTLVHSLLIVFVISCTVSLFLLVTAPRLIHWWVGSRIHPPFFLLLGLAIYSIFECGSFTIGAFLNAAEAVRFQICLSILFGTACIATKVVLVRRFGIAAMPWSTIISCILVQVVPWFLFIPHFLHKLELKSKPVNLPAGASCSLIGHEAPKSKTE
jgi:O-antigen/teichoic acid export membrane protein